VEFSGVQEAVLFVWIVVSTAYTSMAAGRVVWKAAKAAYERKMNGEDIIPLKEGPARYCRNCGKELEVKYRETGFDAHTGKVQLESWLECPSYLAMAKSMGPFGLYLPSDYPTYGGVTVKFCRWSGDA
jgi:hypothetical protein